jgi:hypothetical protein
VGAERDAAGLNVPDSYRRKADMMWSRRAPVAPWSLLVVRVDARVESRCRARLASVRTVTSIALSTRAFAWSKPGPHTLGAWSSEVEHGERSFEGAQGRDVLAQAG